MLGFHSTVRVVFHTFRWMGTFIPEVALMLCGGVLVLIFLLLCEAVQDQRALQCYESILCTPVLCLPKFIIELFSFRKLCN